MEQLPMTYDGVRAALAAPDTWGGLGADQISRLAELATFIYGRTGDEALMDALPAFYPHFAEQVGVEQRREVFARLATSAREEEVRPHALYPFLLCEDDPEIVANAALDIALCHQPAIPDVPEGPEQVLALVLAGGTVNPGAALAGLLSIGDADVCRRLAPLRSILALPQLDHTLLQLVTTTIAPLHLATVLFYVEWLEELASAADGHAFAHVASGLAILRRHAGTRVVIDGRRRFPTPRAGVAYLPGMRVLTLDEAAARIAPRLHGLAAADPTRRILRRVLQTWDLPLRES